MKKLKSVLLLCLLLFVQNSFSQVSDTPSSYYKWKGSKTETHAGYVVLKSGKRLDGEIRLKGSESAITEIEFTGDGKDISFPPAALQSYGLTGIVIQTQSSSASVPGAVLTGLTNDSPEEMYDWKFVGVVMNKNIYSTTPRNGYVILTDGSRHDGELKLKRKEDELDGFEIKSEGGKEKYDVSEVTHYGYNLSDDEFQQQELAREAGKMFPGKIVGSSGELSGEIGLFGANPGGMSYSKFTFKGNNGAITAYDPSAIQAFYVTDSKGNELKYIAFKGVYVEQDFDGNTFSLFRNPTPTTVNEFATNMAKTVTQAGTTAAATAIMQADQKKNNYDSNIDSIIRVSSTEDLYKVRDGLVALSGYTSYDEAMEKSDSESLKNNLGALQLAIAGRESAASQGAIMNEEWIIQNKKTGEQTIVYKSSFKDQIEPLLKGCYEYLTMEKSQQNDFSKWSNIVETMKLIDACY